MDWYAVRREEAMPQNRWYRLDSAAVMVPCSVHGTDTRVFRITCELKEAVDPEVLQQALDETYPEFPHFQGALRKGLFWYYLDPVREKPCVVLDDRPALTALYTPGKRSLLYRISWYGNRINLEMFHVLADGTGAFVFLRKLLMRYLAEKHGFAVPESKGESSSSREKSTNAFSDYYQNMKSSQLKDLVRNRAYQLTGERDPNHQNHLIEGVLPVRQFLKLAKEYETTVGVLATSVYIASVIDVMRIQDQRRPVVVSVPVNLRQFFPSETTRNFFGVINISYDPKEYDGTLESIIQAVRTSFAEQLTEDRVAATMNSYTNLIRNYVIKAVPLFVKEPVLTLALLLARAGVTGSLSNLGRIQMPEEIAGYIDHFSAFMTAPKQQITMASFGDKLSFGIAEGFTDHDVAMKFFRRLTAMGCEVTLATNDFDADSASADPGRGRKRAVLSEMQNQDTGK